MRWTAFTLGLNRHAYHNALSLLAKVTPTLEHSYSTAAAALSIAAKIEHGRLISRFKELPVKKGGLQVPRVSMGEVAKSEA